MALSPSKHEAPAFSTLSAMGYEQEYIRRAVAVYKRTKPVHRANHEEHDLSLLVEIISRLKVKDASKDKQIEFRAHFESENKH